MANYTAADVKALRDRTNAGMMDCKKALDEADGDLEKAIEILRVNGLKGVAKREDRTTANGLIAAKVEGTKGYLFELACETDFVAKAQKFIDLAEQIADAIAALGAENAEAALAAPVAGKTVGELITDESAVIGEKVQLGRLAKIEAEHFALYLHRTNPDLPPQVGVLVGYNGTQDAETGHGIAQHIAFADPTYLTREEIPAATIENETRLAEETARNEGKPEAALPKIIEGRVNGFYKSVVLLDQEYVKDNKVSIGRLTADAGMAIVGFARFRIGA